MAAVLKTKLQREFGLAGVQVGERCVFRLYVLHAFMSYDFSQLVDQERGAPEDGQPEDRAAAQVQPAAGT